MPALFIDHRLQIEIFITLPCLSNDDFSVYLLIRKRAGLRYVRRLLAGYRLPSGKYAGILTDIQTKVK